jgi:hypothetical protein
MKLPRFLRAAILLGCAAVSNAYGQSQTQAQTSVPQTQTVVIAVKDQSGAVIERSDVHLTPTPENVTEKLQTNRAGELMLHLKSGTYTVTVSHAGFKSFSTDIEVTAGPKAQVVPVALLTANLGGVMVTEKGALALSIVPLRKNVTIHADELKAMPRKKLTVHNPNSNADETYEGVLLADLLTKYGAPLGKDLRGPALGYYVVGTGSDGYKAVYSLAEVDPSFHPGDVIVADTMDGKPLDEHSGPYRLVSTEDKRPARGVRNLVSLEVRAAGE